MRTPRIVDAMNYIDDELVSWAIEYCRYPLPARLVLKSFLKACACFVIVALVFGVIFFRGGDGNVVSSPFFLTAYATSTNDGNTITNTLELGRRVPISTFETTNGLTGFVVSCNKTDSNMSPSIAIVSNGDNRDNIEEIVGIATDSSQNYYFYILGENETEPYTLPLSLTDKEANLIYQYTVTIRQFNGIYYAELTEENVMERITK